MTNWANRGKAAIKAVPLSKGGAKKGDRGVRYEGTIVEAGTKTFSTGSFGITVGYQIEGMKYPVRENIVLIDAKGAPTKYGLATLTKRLQAAGNTSDRINDLPVLEAGKDAANAAILADYLSGAAVAVYLVDREYMGKAKKDVRAVFPLDNDGDAA